MPFHRFTVAFFIAIVAMFAMDWKLALISLVVVPPAAATTRYVARTRYKITNQRKYADHAARDTPETLWLTQMPRA